MGMSWSDYLGIGLQGGGAVAGGIFGGRQEQEREQVSVEP